MAELKILTIAVIGAGAESIATAIAADAHAAAHDILLIVTEKQQLQANFDALKNEFDLLPDISKSYKELEEGFDALKKEHEALAKINAELTEQLEALPPPENEKQKPALSDKTFTHEKQTYGFAYPQLKLDGSVITADDVVNSKDLQKKLVEMKSGFIKAV